MKGKRTFARDATELRRALIAEIKKRPHIDGRVGVIVLQDMAYEAAVIVHGKEGAIDFISGLINMRASNPIKYP
jgi:hypothetical protein